MDDLFDFAVRECEKLLKKAPFAAEFNVVEGSSESVGARDSRLDDARFGSSVAANVRVVKDGLVGFAFTKEISKDSLGKMLEGAVVSARARGTKAYFDAFPSKPKAKKFKHFDKRLKRAPFEPLALEFSSQLERALEERHIFNAVGGVSKTQTRMQLLNSSGTSLWDESCDVTCTIMCSAKDKKTSVGSHSKHFARLKDVELDLVREKAVEEAINCLNPVKPKTGKFDLLMPTSSIAGALLSWVVPAMNGDRALSGKSFFSGKKGAKAFSDALTLREKPHEDWLWGSCSYDDEGVATTEKELLREGVLVDYLHDLQSAKKYSAPLTGNGFSPGIASEPGAGVTNIELAPGKIKESELLESVEKGVVVTDSIGGPTFNHVSGDFSIVISSGYLVEGGERTKGVTGLAYSSNIFALLKELELSRETETHYGFIGPRLCRIPRVRLA
ncbi:MAG TPA: TldD/PmbA family protein [archaeon]|nr:TldD/PmbA family protein [archaeon]